MSIKKERGVPGGTVVETPRLTTVEHAFDLWLEKFHTLHIVPRKGSMFLKRDREKKTSGNR